MLMASLAMDHRCPEGTNTLPAPRAACAQRCHST